MRALDIKLVRDLRRDFGRRRQDTRRVWNRTLRRVFE
jgi:hypothetical protein